MERDIRPACDRFELPRLRQIPWLPAVCYREEFDSTQRLALDALAAPAEPFHLPALFLARRQTGGRGRGGKRWWAESGALTFSLAIPVDSFGSLAEQIPRLSLAAAVAVNETVCRLAPEVPGGIKWPNDVYLHGRKIAGLLIELPSAVRRAAVIGVGLNVNNSLESAPAELRASATSLVDATRQRFDLTEVLTDLLSRLHARLGQAAGDDAELSGLWQRRSLLDGRQLAVRRGTETLRGRCRGLDERGALLLETSHCTVPLLSGQVVDVNPPL